MIIDLACVRPTAVQPSPRVLAVAGMFGLGIDQHKHLNVVPPTQLELLPATVTLTIGPSGSGKSTILKLIEQTCCDLPDSQVRAINFDHLPPMPDKPLIDCLDQLPLNQALELLSIAGLNDAFVMLRKPSELSDGQRYRFKLALAFALASQDVTEQPAMTVILADEFGATLDRITAKVIARQVGKWTRRCGNACFVAATTHDDLLEAMDPDVLLEKPLGESLHVWKKAQAHHE